jgi:hypothetical protein
VIAAEGAVSQIVSAVPGGWIIAAILAGLSTAGGLWLKFRKAKVLEYADLLARAKEERTRLESDNAILLRRQSQLWDLAERRRRALGVESPDHPLAVFTTYDDDGKP